MILRLETDYLFSLPSFYMNFSLLCLFSSSCRNHSRSNESQQIKFILFCLSGNKILTKMGLSLLGATISGQTFKAPDPRQPIKDTYHFRHSLHRFANHVTTGEELSKHEEECLKKLGNDCGTYLNMKAHDSYLFNQVVSTLTDILKKTGLPQVSKHYNVL